MYRVCPPAGNAEAFLERESVEILLDYIYWESVAKRNDTNTSPYGLAKSQISTYNHRRCPDLRYIPLTMPMLPRPILPTYNASFCG